jgi:hypothetical protein
MERRRVERILQTLLQRRQESSQQSSVKSFDEELDEDLESGFTSSSAHDARSSSHESDGDAELIIDGVELPPELATLEEKEIIALQVLCGGDSRFSGAKRRHMEIM